MATGIYLGRSFLSSLESTLATDPEKEKHEQARLRAREHLKRLGRDRQNGGRALEGDNFEESERTQRGPRADEIPLNEYESLIAMEMVAPEDIPVGFDGKGIVGQEHHDQVLRWILRYRRVRGYH